MLYAPPVKLEFWHLG